MTLRILVLAIASVLAACGNTTDPTSQTSTANTPSASSSSGSSSSSSGSSTSSGGAASTAGVYLPYKGSSKSLLVSSKNLAAPPESVDFNLALSANGPAFFADQLQLDGSKRLTGFERYSAVFTGAGPDGNYHVYGVQLADVTGTPAPVQLSNLSLPQSMVCQTFGGQTNILDPTTVFVVQSINSLVCGRNDTFVLIHWADLPTVAPIPTQIPNEPLAALYQPDGTLGGLLVFDTVQGYLDFFGASALSGAPTILATGVTAVQLQYDSSLITTGSLAAGSTEFVDVTTNSGEQLLRVSYSGATTSIYQVTGVLGGFVADSANLYFYDAVSATSQQHIYQQPLSATSPAEIELFTASPVVYNSHGLDTLVPMQLLGANGKQLVVANTTYDLTRLPPIGAAPPVPLSTSIQSLAVGVSGTPTTLAGPLDNIWVSAFMTTPTPGDYASQVVYLNELIPSASNAGHYSYTSEVLSATGTVLSGPQSNATFIEVPRCDASQRGTPLANYYAPVLQFSGITDADGMLGGSTVTNFEVSGPPNPPLQDTNGNNFLVPANSAPVLCAASSSVLTGSLEGSSQILAPGSNPYFSAVIPQLFSTLLPQTGIAINLSSGQIAEVAGATQGY